MARVVSSRRGARNKKVHKAPPSSTKKRKFVRFNMPLGEVHAIQKDWIEGKGDENTITALAKKYGRDRWTVSKIVHCPEVQEVAEAMQRKFLMETAEKVVTRIDYEIGNKRSGKGADFAMELADRWGAIPQKISRHAIFPGRGIASQPTESEESRVKKWVERLTEVTMERAEIFDMPMPELEEFKDDLDIPLPVKTKLKKEQVE